MNKTKKFFLNFLSDRSQLGTSSGDFCFPTASLDHSDTVRATIKATVKIPILKELSGLVFNYVKRKTIEK